MKKFLLTVTLVFSLVFVSAISISAESDGSLVTPQVSQLSPTSAVPGATVTVYGSNFSTDKDTDNIVYLFLNNVGVQQPAVLGANSSSLSFKVPNVAPGLYYLAIFNGSVWSNTVRLNILPPTSTQPSITSITPSSGSINSLIMINGLNFVKIGNETSFSCPSPDGNGRIGGGQANVSSADGKTIMTYVPTFPVSIGSTLSYPLQCMVKVSNVFGTSNNINFSITAATSTATSTPSITILSPNGGENYMAGSILPIRWNTSNFGSLTVWLTLADKYGTTVPGGKLNAANIPNNGAYNWIIPNDLVSTSTAGAFKIVASSYDNGPSASDLSDSYFTITASQDVQPSITITSPNWQKTYRNGETVHIIWTATAVSSTDRVYLIVNKENGTRFNLGSSYAVTGRYDWTVPANYANGNYKILISEDPDGNDAGDILAESDYFTITSATTVTVQPSITVTSPNGGTYQVGNVMQISWNIAGNIPIGARVNLQMSYTTNDGRILEDVIRDESFLAGPGGSYVWAIPAKYGSGMNPGRFKMRAILSGPGIPGTNPPQDYSDSYFTITAPTTTLKPNLIASTPTVALRTGGVPETNPPNTFFPGSTMILTSTISNSSFAQAGVSTALFQYTKTSATNANYTNLNGSPVSVSSLSAGANTPAIYLLRNYSDVQIFSVPGDYYVRACADYPLPGAVAEFNETDNCSSPVKITITTPAAATCTYTYSAWSACSSSGTQTNSVISSSPSGCTGTPVTSQSCTYVGLQPSITVTSPNGGDNIIGGGGRTINVQWRTQNWPSDRWVTVEFLDQAGNIVTTGSHLDPNGSYSVGTGAPTTAKTYRIRVYGGNQTSPNVGPEAYSGFFTVAPPPTVPNPTVTVSASPNPVPYNTAPTVSWSSANATSCVSAHFSTGGTVNGQTVGRVQTAPYTYTVECKNGSNVSVSGSVTVAVQTTSVPRASVSLPATNSSIVGKAGTTYTVQWATENWPSDARVNIYLVGNDGSYQTLAGSYANSGTFTATINYDVTETKTYRVRVANATAMASGTLDAGSGLEAYSGSFTITVPLSITVTSPNGGGEAWSQNGNYIIHWTYSGLNNNDTVNIGFVSSDGSVCWVGTSPVYHGRYDITPTFAGCSNGAPNDLKKGGQYKVRLAIQGVTDESDNYFTIAAPQPSITVISPTAGDTIVSGAGKSIIVRWDAKNWPSDRWVTVDFLDSNNTVIWKGNYLDPASGSYTIGAGGVTTTKTYHVRVYGGSEASPNVGPEVTSGDFTVVPPTTSQSESNSQQLASVLESLRALLESMRQSLR